jgi:hypothetical protein
MSADPTAAIIAAVARRRQALLEREEESMTGYTSGNLGGDWEFKIVRAGTPVFRRRETLEQLIEEEARAGWVMLEKLDDSRIHFKRQRSARTKDTYLPPGVDPYRTHYGPTYAQSRRIVVLVAALGVLVLTGFAALGLMLALMR